ncbi:leucine rich repeat protein, bspa family protein [Entamoeba histolytica HM-3:IMSS]|nr:leucine rich repeat protein, bspa family protein [Entamoeba histolytica HM-3:IMSS]GAT97217.1 leucine rich repeat protein bspa family [Entamoeba histolytica]
MSSSLSFTLQEIMTISQYLKTTEDFIRLQLVKKSFSCLTDMFKENPISSPIFRYITTQNIYSRDDRIIPNLSCYIIHYKVSYNEYLLMKKDKYYFKHIEYTKSDREKTKGKIPQEITCIGEKCFYNCDRLSTINIPDSVTSIEYSGFKNCLRLTSICLPSRLLKLKSNCFENCQSLKVISFPSTLTSIPDACLWKCYSLTSIQFPSNLSSLGVNSLSQCTSLISFSLPPHLEVIGDAAFWGCCSIRRVLFPSSVTSVGNGAFWSCVNLFQVSAPLHSTPIRYGVGCFRGCKILSQVEGAKQINW